MSLTVIKIVAIAVAGSLLVLLVNANRGVLALPPSGACPGSCSRYWGYCSSGASCSTGPSPGGTSTPSAATRKPLAVLVSTQSGFRTMGFTICSLNGGLAGLLLAGQFRGVSTSVDGGQLVLYSIAAAVIGGTSLFGAEERYCTGSSGGWSSPASSMAWPSGAERLLPVRHHRAGSYGRRDHRRRQPPPGRGDDLNRFSGRLRHLAAHKRT